MKYTKILFFLFLVGFTTTAFGQENAATIIANAQKQAKAENKNVLVFFHASWCSWCKLMEKKMSAAPAQELFDKNYVIASIDVLERGAKKKLENPGGDALMQEYGGKDAGLPYFAFINSSGEMLENSLNEKKENLGCPSTPEEIKSFTEKLAKTSKLNPRELDVITQVFTEK